MHLSEDEDEENLGITVVGYLELHWRSDILLGDLWLHESDFAQGSCLNKEVGSGAHDELHRSSFGWRGGPHHPSLVRVREHEVFVA